MLYNFWEKVHWTLNFTGGILAVKGGFEAVFNEVCFFNLIGLWASICNLLGCADEYWLVKIGRFPFIADKL